MSNPNRPSNAGNAASLVVEPIAEMTEIVRDAPSKVTFSIFVVDENGVPKILSYTRKRAWQQAIADLTGRDVHAFPFIGSLAPVSAPPPPPAPQFRYVLMPTGSPLPLFELPAALQPETAGLMCQPYRELTVVHEDAANLVADDEPVAPSNSEIDASDGGDDEEEDGPNLI